MTKSIYIQEATVTELLAELADRYEKRNPVPEWAGYIVYAVAAYYEFTVDQLRSKRRTDQLTRAKHLAIALLAQMAPHRSRTEICEVLNLEQDMYRHAIARTEERVSRFSDFRREVAEIVQVIKETRDGNGHCRTSPRGTSGDLAANLPSTAIGAPPSKIAS